MAVITASPGARFWLILFLLLATAGPVLVEAVTGSMTFGMVVGICGLIGVFGTARRMGVGHRFRVIRAVFAFLGLGLGSVVLMVSAGDVWMTYLPPWSSRTG